MPVFNWFKIHQTNNLTYLRRTPLKEFEENPHLRKIWFKLNDEFLQRFGLTEDFKKLIRLKKQRISQLMDYVLKDEPFKLTEAELTTVEINELIGNGDGVTDEETIFIIEEQLGFKMDVKKLTVVEYYNYLEFINKKLKGVKNG